MKRKGKVFIILGLLLIAAALSLTVYNLREEQQAGASVRQVIDRLEAPSVEETVPTAEETAENPAVPDIPDYVLTPELEMPVKTIDGIDYVGVLRIPALNLELPIISQWSYASLKTAPCRYSGSAYTGDLILAGHNYTTHFGTLKNLHEGDTATFTDMEGNVFTYVMAERETLQPTAVEQMQSGDWDLTLFTCTLGGQSRVTIRFVRADDAMQ